MRALKPVPDSIFISYRSTEYENALRLKALFETGCGHVRMLEPGVLALPNEVRTAFGYFELIAQLESVVLSADAFVALDTPGYLESWWTGSEVNIWATKYRYLALFGVGTDGELYYKRMQKVGSVFFERWFLKYRLWVVRNPDAHRIVGPLANSCLMVPCPGCHQLLLVSKAWVAEFSPEVRCPDCLTVVHLQRVGNRFVLEAPLGRFTADYAQDVIALLRGGSAHHLERRPSGQEYVIIHYHGQALPLFRLPHEETGS